MGLTCVSVDKVKDLITFCRPKKQGSGKHPCEINNYSTKYHEIFVGYKSKCNEESCFFELVSIWWR